MNYLSQPHSVRQPIEMGGNLQLAINTANTLQSKYDSNKAIIDSTLAQYEGLRGLTDTDNAYIAAQISNVKNQINSLGSLNLAHSSGRDTILNNMKSIFKDKVIQDILVSKNNVDSLNAEYKKIVEKDSTKANKDNLDFALNQGGYYDYVQGKTKKVGSMSYVPFENVSANYSKRLKEYVEQYDDEQLIQQGAGIEGSKYHTVDIYGKVVLKEDLEKFLKQTTTPQEATQMHINAWSKFKSVDEQGAGTILKPIYEGRLKDLKEQEAIIQAKVDSGDKKAKQSLTNIQNTIESTSAKIKSGGFTKNELYTEYNDSFIKDMASLYDKNVITKKDVQDYLFDEVKFETEQKRWELTFDQKEREIALKQKEVSMQEAITNGTLTEYPTTPEEKKDSEFTTFNKEKTASFQDVVNKLSISNPDFAKKSTREKATYLANLDVEDPSKIKDKSITPALRNSIIKWQKLNENSANFYSDNLKTVQPTIIGSFQDMQNSYFKDKNSELALDKVGAYLPNTSRVIKEAKKSGKQLSWADISEDDRYAIQVEFLSQYRREGNLSDDQTKVFATNEYIMKNKIKNKALVTNLNTLDKERGTAEMGYFKTLWEGVKETGKNIGGGIMDIGSAVKRGVNTISEGSEYAQKQYDKDISESYVGDHRKMAGIFNIIPTNLVAAAINPLISEEENLRNIESRDLLGRENIANRFETYKNNMDVQMKEKFGTESPFQKYQKAVSYSTTIKEQKNTAELIRQTIMATAPDAAIPEGDNFTVKQKGAGFEIMYQVKEKEGLINAEPIYLDRLPETLQRLFQQKQDDWQKSIYNPNFKVPSFTFETPQTEEEGKEIFRNLVTYGQLDENIAESLYASGKLATASSYVNRYVSKETQKRNEKAIDVFEKQKFKTNTEVINGRLWSTITHQDIQNGKLVQTDPFLISMPNEQIETIDVQLSLLHRVDKLKQEQLASLK